MEMNKLNLRIGSRSSTFGIDSELGPTGLRLSSIASASHRGAKAAGNYRTGMGVLGNILNSDYNLFLLFFISATSSKR